MMIWFIFIISLVQQWCIKENIFISLQKLDLVNILVKIYIHVKIGIKSVRIWIKIKTEWVGTGQSSKQR